MGKATKGIITLAVTMGLAMTANAAEFVAKDNSLETRLCITAATATKAQMGHLARNMKLGSTGNSTGYGYNKIANSVYCNGENITDFAFKVGNIEVADKLAEYRTGNVQVRDLALLSSETMMVSGSK